MNAIGTDKLACKEVIPALSIGSLMDCGQTWMSLRPEVRFWEVCRGQLKRLFPSDGVSGNDPHSLGRMT